MKLMLYDKFFDALINLPKHAQKKVGDFIRKFQEDSKSAAIHLEPISTFKDANLRTARIDKTYRAIIHHPSEGDVFHLLWADHHDKAMAWAENKVFQWNDQTQSYQIYTAPEVVEEQAASYGPKTSEAMLLGNVSDEDLIKVGVPEVLLPSIRRINSMDDLEQMEEYLPVEAFENLFFLLDGEPVEQLIIEVEEGKVASEDFVTQQQSANNQRSFFSLTDDQQLNDILSGDLQKWKIYLHPSQRKLVQGSFNGSVKVTGGAGTGKTVAALHRAKWLQDHSPSYEYGPILFSTFTKSLTENLKQELSGMNIDSRKVTVINIDAFAVEHAKELGLVRQDVKILDFPGCKSGIELWRNLLEFELSTFEAAFLEEEYKQVILFNNVKDENAYYKVSRVGRKQRISRKDKMNIWSLVKAYESLKKKENHVNKEEVFNLVYDYYRFKEEKPFAHIIADEVQDFSNVELRMLRALVAEKPNDLFFVGDPLQRVYSRRINFSKAGINIRGRRSRRLKINYRTTEEIRRTAVGCIKAIRFDDFDGETERKNGYVSLRRGGVRPSYEVFRDEGQEGIHIIKKLREYSANNHPGAFSFNEMCIAAHFNRDIKSIKTLLHKEGIPYYDISDAIKTGNKTSGVRLSTFHNMKGLEFKVVFLMNVNDRTMPYRPRGFESWDRFEQEEYEKREKALIYVAMTRAIHILQISGVGKKSPVIVD